MGFSMSIGQGDLAEYSLIQIDHFFPDNQYGMSRGAAASLLQKAMPTVIERLEKCIGSINAPNYHDEFGNATFSHLHADQYATYLYFLSNTIWKDFDQKIIADKFMYLNRALHGVYISYKCPLPEHFFLSHPVGTVLGNAEYGDFLVVLQNVTVNTGLNGGKSPKIGNGVFLSAGCSIIGNEDIGDRVSLGAGTLVFQQYIPNDSVVKVKNGSLCCIEPRKNEICRAQRDFNILF